MTAHHDTVLFDREAGKENYFLFFSFLGVEGKANSSLPFEEGTGYELIVQISSLF
jgi:hypothetical protein